MSGRPRAGNGRAIAAMTPAPRRQAAAALRRGRLRGGRPCRATALRCAVRGRTAELAARPADAALKHAAVSQKWRRAVARRPRPCAARHRVLWRPRRSAATARNQHLDHRLDCVATARSGRLPYCNATAFAEIRVPCTGSGPIEGRGAQRRRRGGARPRASTSDSRPLSERSVPEGRRASWPCAPAPSSTTESARRADRGPGPEPVQGARISFMTPCATVFSRPLRMDDTPQENAKN